MAPVTGDHAVWYYRVYQRLINNYAQAQQVLFFVAVADDTYTDVVQVSYYLFGPSPPPINEVFDDAAKQKSAEMFTAMTTIIDTLKLGKSIRFFRSGVSGAGGRNRKHRGALAFVEHVYAAAAHEDTLNAIQIRGFEFVEKIIAAAENAIVVIKPYRSNGVPKSKLKYPVDHNRVLNWRWFTPQTEATQDAETTDAQVVALFQMSVAVQIKHSTAEFCISIIVADVYGSQAYYIEHKWSINNKTKNTIEFLANEDILRVCQMFDIQLCIVVRANSSECNCPSCLSLCSIKFTVPNSSWLIGGNAPVVAGSGNDRIGVVYWSTFPKKSTFYQTFMDAYQMDKVVTMWATRYFPGSNASVYHCCGMGRGLSDAFLAICLWTIEKSDYLADWILRPLQNIGDSGCLTLEGDTIANLCLREISKLYTPTTPMGRRALEHRLFNPPSDPVVINKLYDLNESVERLVIRETAETRFFGPQDLNKLINDMKRGKSKYADIMAVYNSLHTLLAHPWAKCTGASELLDFYKAETIRDIISETFDMCTLDTFMSRTMTEMKLSVSPEKLKICLLPQRITNEVSVPVSIHSKQYKYLIESMNAGGNWCINGDIVGSKVSKQFIVHFDVAVSNFLEHIARIQEMYQNTTATVQTLVNWKAEDSTFAAFYFCRNVTKMSPVIYIRIPNYAADVLEQKIKKGVFITTHPKMPQLNTNTFKIKKNINIKSTDDDGSTEDGLAKKRAPKPKAGTTAFVKIHKQGHRDAALFRFMQNLVDEFCAVFGSWLYANHVTDLFEIAAAIGHLDATVSIVNRSRPDKLNLIRPSIVPQTKDASAFINTKGLVHPYINEQLKASSDGKPYYNHEINIGADGAPNGVLLYGVNTSGKSTVLRAIGTSIVMAQAGFGVPARSYELRPYSCIVTHINVSDCVHTGKSKFERQCIETNVVQQYSGLCSLFLADELYNGTSHHEVVSLTVAAVERFVEQRWSFIVTSHEMDVLKYLFDGSMKRNLLAVKSIDYRPPERPIVDGLVFHTNSQYGLSTFINVGGDMAIANRAANIQQKMTSTTNSNDDDAIKQYYRPQQELPMLLTQQEPGVNHEAATRLASKFDQFRFKRKAVPAPAIVNTKRQKVDIDDDAEDDKQKPSSYNTVKIKTNYCERKNCVNNSRFGGPQVATEIHHIVPREVLRMYPEYVQYQHCVWNLKELCLSCHKEITTRDSTRKSENKVSFRTAYMRKFNLRRQRAQM